MEGDTGTKEERGDVEKRGRKEKTRNNKTY